MAGGTNRVECNGDGWSILAQNCASAIIQLEGDGPALIRVGQSDPGAGVDTGAILWRSASGITAIPITGLTSGTDIVYGRMKNSETEYLIAVTTG